MSDSDDAVIPFRKKPPAGQPASAFRFTQADKRLHDEQESKLGDRFRSGWTPPKE